MLATMSDKHQECPLLEENGQPETPCTCAESIRRAIERSHLQPVEELETHDPHPSAETIQAQCRENFQGCNAYKAITKGEAQPSFREYLFPVGYTESEARNIVEPRGIYVSSKAGHKGRSGYSIFKLPDGNTITMNRSAHTGQLYAGDASKKAKFDAMMGLDKDFGPTKQVCLKDVGAQRLRELMHEYKVEARLPDGTPLDRITVGSTHDPKAMSNIFIDIPESAEV